MTEPSVGGASDHPKPSKDVVQALTNGLKLGASLMATWGVALLVRFQLPRHVGPEQFGIYNFSDNFAFSFLIFTGFGLDAYCLREIPTRPKHAQEFFGGIFVVRLIASALLFAIMAVVLVVTGKSPVTIRLVAFFSVNYVVVILNNTLSAMLTAHGTVGRLAMVNVVAKFAWGGLTMLGIWMSWPLETLAAASITSEVIRLGVLLPAARSQFGLKMRVDTAVTRTVLIACIPLFVNGIVITLAGKLDVTMLGLLASDTEVGWYGASTTLANLALLVSPVLGWVVMPLLSRAIARSEDEFFVIVRRSIEGIIASSIPIAVVTGLGAEFWIERLFKAQFLPAATALKILSPIFVFTYLAMTMGTALIVMKRTWTLTMISVVGLCLNPVLLLILIPIMSKRLGPGGAAAGAGLSLLLMEMTLSCLFLYNMGRRTFDKRSVLTIVKSITAWVAVAVMDHFLRPYCPPLVRIAIDVVVYVALAVATKAIRVDEAIRLGRSAIAERRARKAAE